MQRRVGDGDGSRLEKAGDGDGSRLEKVGDGDGGGSRREQVKINCFGLD